MNKKPTVGVGDIAHASARALLGALPIVGPAAAELLTLVIEPPLSKRRAEWLELIATRLAVLESERNDFRVVNLVGNEAFLDTVLQATQAAMRTHQSEKIEALRNAVLNVALSDNVDEVQISMFVSFLDGMTPLHLHVLKNFDASGDLSLFTGSPLPFIKQYIPELTDRMELYEQIVRDLYGRGLVYSNVTAGTATAFGKFTGTITDFGQEFLSFISSPTELNSK